MTSLLMLVPTNYEEWNVDRSTWKDHDAQEGGVNWAFLKINTN
jgi:hypothetical protein